MGTLQFVIAIEPTPHWQTEDNPSLLSDNGTQELDLPQEILLNGDFSNPIIGTGTQANSTSKTWDTWSGVPGWQAMVGNIIEYQVIDSRTGSGQYCELKADLQEITVFGSPLPRYPANPT